MSSNFHGISEREQLLLVGESEAWWSRTQKGTTLIKTLNGPSVIDESLVPWGQGPVESDTT